MNCKTQQRWGWVRAATPLAALALCVAWPSLAQLSRAIKHKDVVFPQYYDDPLGGPNQTNRLKVLLKGAEGRYLSNDTYLITQMQLEHLALDGRTNLVARAPECLFDAKSQLTWSTGRLEVVGMGGAVHIFGYAGFEVRTTNSSMSLSNRVRAVFRQDLLKTVHP